MELGSLSHGGCLMPNYSLIFARTLQHATDSAVIDWQWEPSNELRNEFRRPDTGEKARWVPDVPSALYGLRWLTVVYLGREWEKRRDSEAIRLGMESGFFKQQDPQLPPPRPRRSRDDDLSTIRRLLAQVDRN